MTTYYVDGSPSSRIDIPPYSSPSSIANLVVSRGIIQDVGATPGDLTVTTDGQNILIRVPGGHVTQLIPVSPTPETGYMGRSPLMQTVAYASSGIGVYHGYRRNNSLGWGLWWGFLGFMFPIIVPAVALAQGLGKPKARSNPSGRRRRNPRR